VNLENGDEIGNKSDLIAESKYLLESNKIRDNKTIKAEGKQLIRI